MRHACSPSPFLFNIVLVDYLSNEFSQGIKYSGKILEKKEQIESICRWCDSKLRKLERLFKKLLEFISELLSWLEQI